MSKVKIFLFFNTIVHLKPIQIAYQLWYRLPFYFRRLFYSKEFKNIDVVQNPLKFGYYIPKRKSYGSGSFFFLNRNLRDCGKTIWEFKDYGKLWTYNLNYMDFLVQENLSKEKGLKLISDFIDSISTIRAGNESYPISLRTVNWIKFLSKHEISDEIIGRSLLTQIVHLFHNIEYHLLGNHLLENSISLLFGGFYFRNKEFYRKGRSILEKELCEQILADGGHFEQSPMYHLIILERLFDAINLLKKNLVFLDQEELQSILSKKASLMLGWINRICFRNGNVPLFNDCANNIAPSIDQVNFYAKTLCISREDVSLSESGYRNISNSCYEMKLFIGNETARYNAGHFHADTFSFELYSKQKPFIVDTGTSTYEENERRLCERGTSSHNTVQINGKNSSEVWASFRVARRARVIQSIEKKGNISVRHDGYKKIGVEVKRLFKFRKESIEIEDSLIGIREVEGISRFHFHPDVKFRVNGQSVLFEGGSITFEGACEIRISEFFYAPEFNRLINSRLVEIVFREKMNSVFSFND